LVWHVPFSRVYRHRSECHWMGRRAIRQPRAAGAIALHQMRMGITT
jgi:hypothetical protein